MRQEIQTPNDTSLPRAYISNNQNPHTQAPGPNLRFDKILVEVHTRPIRLKKLHFKPAKQCTTNHNKRIKELHQVDRCAPNAMAKCSAMMSVSSSALPGVLLTVSMSLSRNDDIQDDDDDAHLTLFQRVFQKPLTNNCPSVSLQLTYLLYLTAYQVPYSDRTKIGAKIGRESKHQERRQKISQQQRIIPYMSSLITQLVTPDCSPMRCFTIMSSQSSLITLSQQPCQESHLADLTHSTTNNFMLNQRNHASTHSLYYESSFPTLPTLQYANRITDIHHSPPKSITVYYSLSISIRLYQTLSNSYLNHLYEVQNVRRSHLRRQ